ncbi:hypothetical protein CERSUDRAFT_112464 [Gelatoporia subvermispora B]|uniref:DUF2470 domain-containing protein n=1 Tax=Ceriporiopsis subvermispora (strain B) TaxID=914234 RepID=M2RIU2_CERS8|nr:hypothetical protein CERSUDRAFT_112464 [Gelatoporia subvermispora B]
MSDPVAAKSGFLCMYMSNHPDTLVSYVRHYGKVNDNVVNAEMTAIDTKGMSLTYKTKANGDKRTEIRIPFDPPLAGYEEVKPRLLGMKVDAEEAMGMIRAPKVTTFELPSQVLITASLMLFLFYTTFAPGPDSLNYSSVFAPGHGLRSILPPWVLPSSWGLMITVHSLEALYTLNVARKHDMDFTIGMLHVVTTFLFGFPVISNMRKRIQAARIDSIMKGQ